MFEKRNGCDIEIEIVVRQRNEAGRPQGQAGHEKIVLANNYAGLQKRKALADRLKSFSESLLAENQTPAS